MGTFRTQDEAEQIHGSIRRSPNSARCRGDRARRSSSAPRSPIVHVAGHSIVKHSSRRTRFFSCSVAKPFRRHRRKKS